MPRARLRRFAVSHSTGSPTSPSISDDGCFQQRVWCRPLKAPGQDTYTLARPNKTRILRQNTYGVGRLNSVFMSTSYPSASGLSCYTMNCATSDALFVLLSETLSRNHTQNGGSLPLPIAAG